MKIYGSKKWIAAVCCTVLLLTGIGAVHAESPYPDLKESHWAYTSIKAMSDRGVIKGYPDGTFLPEGTVTYAEFITMMVTAAGEKAETASKPAHWAANYYGKAIDLGYFTGGDIPKGALDQPIPRSYMALMISSALGETGIDRYDDIEYSVLDVDSDTRYDYHIIKSYAAGVMSGYPDGTFQPDGHLNRAEAAVVIHRLLDQEKRTPVTVNQSALRLPEDNPAEGEITIENSYNKDLVWTEVGDITKYIDRSVLDEIGEYWGLTYDKYVLVEDASQFNLQLKSTENLKWIKLDRNADYSGFGHAYLITDGQISEISGDMSVVGDGILVDYEGDFSTVDYIALCPVTEKNTVVTLIKNPYK